MKGETVLSDKRTGVLRPPGPALLRAVPGARGDRTLHDAGGPPAVEPVHRALSPHAPGRAPAGEGARTTWDESVSEMQEDLDACIETYNRNRPQRGRGMEGRTPYQVLKKGIRRPISRKNSGKWEVKTAALKR